MPKPAAIELPAAAQQHIPQSARDHMPAHLQDPVNIVYIEGWHDPVYATNEPDYYVFDGTDVFQATAIIYGFDPSEDRIVNENDPYFSGNWQSDGGDGTSRSSTTIIDGNHWDFLTVASSKNAPGWLDGFLTGFNAIVHNPTNNAFIQVRLAGVFVEEQTSSTTI